MRAFVVARSRYAEDLLARAVTQRVNQYVLLGAGLDTFAHRNPYPSLRVFEVDHPATQQWKRELLEQARLAPPETAVTYIPVDFERQSLHHELQAAGFDHAAPAFFSWLGVVPYITPEAFRTTLALIANQPAGSGFVLDYEQPKPALPRLEQLERESRSYRARLAGEPFKLFFTPAEIAAELKGFRSIEDLGTAGLNERYFVHRTDSLRTMGEAPRIVSGWL